ncbi:hypothetical protein ACYQR9_03910 [Methylobacterium sp. CM6241]
MRSAAVIVGSVASSLNTDTTTWNQQTVIGDNLHWRGATKEQVGTAVLGWIACKETGSLLE